MNVATVLQKTTTANAISLSFWREFLSEKYYASRKITGLPKQYYPKYVIKWLFEHGNLAAFEYKGDFTIAPVTISGEINRYGMPINVTYCENGENFVVPWGKYALWRDASDNVTFNTFMAYFAELCVNCQRAVDTISFWRGTPKMYGVDQKSYNEIQKIIASTDRRDKAVFCLKGFDANSTMSELDFSQDPKHDDACWNNLIKYIKYYDTLIGFSGDTAGEQGGGRDRVTATENIIPFVAEMSMANEKNDEWKFSNNLCYELFGERVQLQVNKSNIEILSEITKITQNQNPALQANEGEEKENDNSVSDEQ